MGIITTSLRSEHPSGREIGSVAQTKKPFLVQDILFSVHSNHIPGCVASINIYRIEGKKESFVNVLPKPVYFDVAASAGRYLETVFSRDRAVDGAVSRAGELHWVQDRRVDGQDGIHPRGQAEDARLRIDNQGVPFDFNQVIIHEVFIAGESQGLVARSLCIDHVDHSGNRQCIKVFHHQCHLGGDSVACFRHDTEYLAWGQYCSHCSKHY